MTLTYDEIMKAKQFLPLKLNPLTNEIIEKAKKELHETDEIRAPAIEQLRKLVFKEKDFTCPTDDAYLLQYLRARKFDVKKAFNLLLSFYQVKRDYPECYKEIEPVSLEQLARSGTVYCLPYRTPDGCAVLVLEFPKWNCQESNIIIIMRMLAIVLLHAAEDPATQVCGIHIIVNVRGATLRQIREVTPRYIHLFSKALRNCMPNRFKGIHIYNESTIFQYMWCVLKLFLTEKIKRRVHFHGDNQKQLHKFIPKEILTSEYGGDNKSFDSGEWCVNMIKEFRPKQDIILANGYQQ